MNGDRQRYALQTIFSFFLGLMVAAFVGVGVNTFYPEPFERFGDELEKLYREQSDLDVKRGPSGDLKGAELSRYEALREQIDELQKKQEDAREVWSRNTSIILILFATFVMATSLVRSEQLRVLSNGLLLGGLFTMVYGTGWVIAAGSSTARFAVMTFALAVTIALGYVKFARERSATPIAAAPAGVSWVAGAGAIESASGEALFALESRLSELERRTAAAAAALGVLAAPSAAADAKEDED